MLYLLGQARNAGVSCLDHGDALLLWSAAWDEWQGSGSPGAGVRSRAEVDAWNQRCEPFHWVKDADTILAKATRPKPPNTQDTSVTRQ